MIKIIGYDKEKNRNEKVEVKDLTIAELDQVVGGIQVTWHDYNPVTLTPDNGTGIYHGSKYF
ncbi:hypothetical protein ACMZ6W_03065 [Streptococcus pluranimalium]